MLKQKHSHPIRVGCQIAIVYAVTKGYLNGVEPAGVAAWEEGLFTYLSDRYGKLMERIESGSWNEEDVKELEAALKGFRR